MSLRLAEYVPSLVGPSAYLAKVVSVQDPDSLNRVQVRIYNCDGNTDEDAPVWARVAMPFAGKNKGAFLFPDTGDEVLVVLLSGDPRFPVVIGSFWNGSDQAPDQISNSVNKWTFTGKNGTKIAILEEQSGQETIKLTTPGGQTAKLTDQGNGAIELSTSGGSSIKIDSQGITVTSSAKVSITASGQVSVSASMVNVDAGMSKFSGVVKCDTLIATSVVGSTYTPGAGNIW